MTGHTKEKCYCIHGYPSWHKLFGKPKPKPRFASANATVKYSSAAHVTSSELPTIPTVKGTDGGSIDSEPMSLSDGQCKQLIMLLQKSMSSTAPIATTVDSEFQSTSWYPPLNSSQFAGTILHVANNVDSDLHYTTDQWIVDTGASDHITPYAHLLQDVKPFKSILHLPNGATADVNLVGTVKLSSDIILTNVLYVPSFAYNLLSISKFLRDNNCTATFTSECCTIYKNRIYNRISQ